mmetsp:Transcript_119120/g.371098  ORF Transcript_119120/g.371098 Transcript_119120/m.371098 type:complete len:211 (-) Transcript_119120:34-666(-)|eukprot:CAMPEP_0204592284 /NCGR_PEP_ID=MMETSP0661-20131031/50851_1 /ASSEMBLY_ACC=CAM_ASM_000606 /TAXON_ID=109239 /ORGANISM="Alexandrium margalefi, Strain AMGDE01CS-322" /LENGTH=210 /DNA_ID=CAMNT_0051602493 /DNA_START=49 /DNA_END=681 /DNA_ORIENTATION=+
MALGPTYGWTFILGLVVAVAEESGGDSQVEPRQLQASTQWMWVIQNEQSLTNDGSAYFDASTNPGYSFIWPQTAVPAEQWRLNQLIWTGNVYLQGNTQNMRGVCAPYACSAKVVSFPAQPRQWRVGDILVVGSAMGAAKKSSSAVRITVQSVSKGGKDSSAVALIVVLCIVSVMALALCGAGAFLLVKRKKQLRASQPTSGEADILNSAV